MTNWAALYDGLRAWFAARSGIDAGDVLWEGEPEGMRGDPCAYLKLIGHASAPTSDEVLYASQGDGQDALVGVRGHRLMTLSCRVQSRLQSPTGRAFVVLEKVRDTLALPSTEQTFRDLGIAAISSAALLDLGRVFDQREESHAVLDLRFAMAVDAWAQETIGTIEQVVVSGTVQQEPSISIPPQTIP